MSLPALMKLTNLPGVSMGGHLRAEEGVERDGPTHRHPLPVGQVARVTEQGAHLLARAHIAQALVLDRVAEHGEAGEVLSSRL
jgi:CTP-dependent riboflavin kinase